MKLGGMTRVNILVFLVMRIVQPLLNLGLMRSFNTSICLLVTCVAILILINFISQMVVYLSMRKVTVAQREDIYFAIVTCVLNELLLWDTFL